MGRSPMFKTAGAILCAVALVAALFWLVRQGQQQAAKIAELETTAAANARAVQEQKNWADTVDTALADWRSQRDQRAKNQTALRQQKEKARHDKTYSVWADSPLPDAAVRLLQANAPAH